MMVINSTDNAVTLMSEIMENKPAAAVAPMHPELPECEIVQ